MRPFAFFSFIIFCLFVGCNCSGGTYNAALDVNCDAVAATQKQLTNTTAEYPQRNWQYRMRAVFLRIRLSRLSYNTKLVVNVPADRLQHLEHIRTLNLNENMISFVHKDAFATLKSLHDLSLMPLRATLKRLDLTDNMITRLDAFTFANFTKLNQLMLRYNLISFVHPVAFANCGRLEKLDMSLNRLRHISARLFYSLVQLAEIELDDEAHDEVFLFSQKAHLLHRRQLGLGRGAVADREQVLVLSQHVHERALANARVAQHDDVVDAGHPSTFSMRQTHHKRQAHEYEMYFCVHFSSQFFRSRKKCSPFLFLLLFLLSAGN